MYSNIEIGQRIQAERTKLGLSRETFAELMGLSAYYIGQIERGNRSMSIDTLIKLSEVLRVSMDYIIKGEEKTPVSNNELQALISKCSIREQELFVDVLKAALPYLSSKN